MLQLELGDGRADKRVSADDAVDIVPLLMSGVICSRTLLQRIQ
jgi:hypothetical protein